MTDPTSEAHQTSSYDEFHARNLEQTMLELQGVVKEHEDALQKLRASSIVSRAGQSLPSTAPYDIMKMAYNELASSTPYLPFPDSVLPALIALRRTHRTVEETKAYLSTHSQSVEDAKKKLELAKVDFSNQQALAHSLRGRIQSLQDGLETRMEMGPEDIARERIEDLKQKKKTYSIETSKLLRSLRAFINDHLAGMLAAEELGGPVVGDMMNINEQDLVAGFNSQGRVKAAKAKAEDDNRQRRIDEIWRPREGEKGRHEKHDRDEITAAGEEMRDLTEQLLNGLAQSQGDSSAAYVYLPKESAAARFLVRAKAAQFHPKDSSRLRLLDFGRELDD
ncbi:hypothetical protein F5B22DRAFT_648590 [Xylaria bambusicola]|uniref:uncharacterized protein n=1 Tax=Xylaria bambusicola TaxID=326684 RepID=UPI00200760B5|nr:uncharacterized protein F5B22DRAFT_648590 [Xylaria bambusicola]KAI0512485.1 hypothetical protein F5B22DRAFT_648590 [Xylaria bambusicola]